MTTKEMIDKLTKIGYVAENPEDCELTREEEKEVPMVIAAIIKTLQDYDDLRLRLQDVKFPVLGKIR